MRGDRAPVRETEADVVIVGAGPGGCAAALTCREAGLQVVLLEAARFPRVRPGETLHPGVESVFARLGVQERVAAAGFIRHRGTWVEWDGPAVFQAYGEDANGPWLGYQAERARLDALLLAAAEAAGAKVGQPEKVQQLLRSTHGIAGVVTDRRTIHARWVIDAAGSGHWLARLLGLPVERHGPQMCARFGWHDGRLDAPRLIARPDGWRWEAPINELRVATCSLVIGEQDPLPNEPLARARPGIGDVTWRCVRACAGPGYFLVGDAAAVVDPLSSHGVLRALLSGLLAGHLLARIRHSRVPCALAAAEYISWLSDSFNRDTAALRELYARHPAGSAWNFPVSAGDRTVLKAV